MQNTRTAGMVLALAALAAFPLLAGETTFVVGEHGKQFNSIQIESHTDLEDIVTTSNAITGSIKWDRTAKTGSVKLTVPVTSLKTGIPERDEHLQGEGWLNAEKHPNITFESTAVKAVDEKSYEATGNFSMAGTTKEVKATVTMKYLPHKPELDSIVPSANFVKAMTTFEIKLSEFGIKFPVVGLKVSDTLKVKVALLGVDEIK